MENPREKAYSFSYCLFAYIYKDIHEKAPLPVIVNYTVPCTTLFTKEVADCVLQACAVNEKFLNPVFSKIFPTLCVSEAYFFEYVKWYYEKVGCSFTKEYYNLYSKCNFEANPVGPFFIKFIALCSFIVELVRFCFNKKCYSFTSSGPTSLAETILVMPEIEEYFCSVSDAFSVLCRFCSDVMSDAAIRADSLSDLFMRQSDFLQQNCSLVLSIFTRPELDLPSPSNKIFSNSNIVEDQTVRHSFKRKLTHTLSDLGFDDMCESNTGCYNTESFEIEQCCDLSNMEQNIDYREAFNKLPFKITHTLNNLDFNDDGMFGKNTDFHEAENAKNYCESSNTEQYPHYFNSSVLNNSPDMSIDKKCPHCKELCLAYLDEFVDDFKETNYEDGLPQSL